MLLQPFCGLIVLAEERAPDGLGVDDVDLVRPLEENAADNRLRNPLAALLGKEHRNHVGHFSSEAK